VAEYRATTDMRGHTVVEECKPCINGLSAWVMVADLGKPYPEDEMFGGLDRDALAMRIVSALGMPLVAPVAWERRQGLRCRDGWGWSTWQTCTEAEARRVTGLQSWQVRRVCECPTCNGTGRVPCGVGGTFYQSLCTAPPPPSREKGEGEK
jgi:hypothetical protein